MRARVTGKYKERNGNHKPGGSLTWPVVHVLKLNSPLKRSLTLGRTHRGVPFLCTRCQPAREWAHPHYLTCAGASSANKTAITQIEKTGGAVFRRQELLSSPNLGLRGLR